jgi:hypothetical protein
MKQEAGVGFAVEQNLSRDLLGTRIYQNLPENGCRNQQRQEKKFKADL